MKVLDKLGGAVSAFFMLLFLGLQLLACAALLYEAWAYRPAPHRQIDWKRLHEAGLINTNQIDPTRSPDSIIDEAERKMEILDQLSYPLHPPKDVRDAGALRVAEEMREWAGEESPTTASN
jgi:hypothetical protein